MFVCPGMKRPRGSAVPEPALAQDGTTRSIGVRAVGESLPHAAGQLHTTGEAEYTDDASAPANTLHGWLVYIIYIHLPIHLSI